MPKEDCKESEEPSEPEDVNVWSEDQKTRQYYYDDAHGYEVYKPEEDDSEGETLDQVER